MTKTSRINNIEAEIKRQENRQYADVVIIDENEDLNGRSDIGPNTVKIIDNVPEVTE